MYPPVAVHTLADLSHAQRQALLTRTEEDLSEFLRNVQPIIEAVQRDGDDALARFAREFDQADITSNDIAVTRTEIDQAFDRIDSDLIETLKFAADNIRRYHEAQMPQEMWMKEIRPGVLVGERFTPVDSVALYSPRGKGSFPSVTLMTAIPAAVAGVPEAIILTPAGPDGRVDAATLVAARLAGVEQVYKAGGGAAVAAAAFGTACIPQCVKFEGPGSPWVIAAKRLLANHITSSLPAGPSESMVLVDDTANPKIAAMDLLIESEHGADSSTFLVTWSASMADDIMSHLPDCLSHMSEQRVTYSSAVLGGNQGGVVLARDAEDAYDFINDYAPEHLQIISKQPYDHLPSIRNAAEILLGEHAPSSIANYVMGPNNVLPTSAGAKVQSPLGVHHFLKSATIGHLTQAGYAQMAPHTERFARYEGFDAHANAVSVLRNKAFE